MNKKFVGLLCTIFILVGCTSCSSYVENQDNIDVPVRTAPVQYNYDCTYPYPTYKSNIEKTPSPTFTPTPTPTPIPTPTPTPTPTPYRFSIGVTTEDVAYMGYKVSKSGDRNFTGIMRNGEIPKLLYGEKELVENPSDPYFVLDFELFVKMNKSVDLLCLTKAGTVLDAYAYLTTYDGVRIAGDYANLLPLEYEIVSDMRSPYLLFKIPIKGDGLYDFFDSVDSVYYSYDSNGNRVLPSYVIRLYYKAIDNNGIITEKDIKVMKLGNYRVVTRLYGEIAHLITVRK